MGGKAVQTHDTIYNALHRTRNQPIHDDVLYRIDANRKSWAQLGEGMSASFLSNY